MADLANLQTASLYINNQLLSRGLLRDGQTIDFADPAGRRKERRRGKDKDAKDTNDGPDGDGIDNDHRLLMDHTADTMARIISVVNDLILRRDRDAEHRESLSTALRTVRAESLRQANDLQRALERGADAQRRADLAEAAETGLRAQLAAAETAQRKLRDDAVKTKQLVAQTRAACTHEVRKRDRQIDALKRAVTDAGRARGERRSPAITTITITGGDAPTAAPLSAPGSARSTPQATPTSHSRANNTAAADVADATYNLRNETNAFLADLARGLSDDNEALLGLVCDTGRRLKAMSGYAATSAAVDSANPDAGEMLSVDLFDTADGGAPDPSALALEMEAVLEHLRTILTNPSFVPIEEVVQRESEILRLRDGWEKMEDRWKEAVHLLDGWRRRMATSGRPVNMEEIKMGLRLSPVRVRSVVETSQGLVVPMRPLAGGVSDDAAHTAYADQSADDGHDDDDDDDDDDDNGYDDSDYDHAFPSVDRTPSPAETLHLVPAPGAGNDARQDGNVLDDSDADSDTSSVFADDGDLEDDDAPNVQIIEQSVVMPSLEASPAPETAFARSTPSPSPPPPEKPAISNVTEAILGERPQQPQQPQEKQRRAAVSKQSAPQQALRPSRTAGNRGGTHGAVASASAPDSKKEPVATARPPIMRGRRRPGEVSEAAKDTRSARPATATDRPGARPTAPRVAAGTAAPVPAHTNSSRTIAPRPAAAARTARSTPQDKLQEITITQEKQRPASAASAASQASERPSGTSSSSSNTSAPLVPLTTATAAAPPAAATTAAASRARSRSPLKAAADGASRLPLPTAATATANMPPASPALNMATIAAKLAASEREADAARVRAKLKAMRNGPSGTKARATPLSAPSTRAASGDAADAAADRKAEVATLDVDSVDPVKKSAVAAEGGDMAVSAGSTGRSSRQDGAQQQQKQQQPVRVKREQRRASKTASRRRSTLNPWELKSLMTGSVEGAATGAL